ncbi:hypothetical protein [Estrella lausannensis]|uniref:Putative secreted protein n=1 Tax=Estrella lausannensis TaxID=483423 RepID=A0A0H5DPZ1_9BACT|nr:hypothetical protein [Estrella lausannensis]CRX38681.1 putative secreted protein [Estrella lausannensis]
MKNYKLAALSLISSTLFLTSCSSSSCYNPCNWKPFWKKSCHPVCYEETTCYEEPACNPEPVCCPAPSCNSSPYPDTSIEDVPTPRYLRQEPINSKDVPYYEDTYPDHQAPSPASSQTPASEGQPASGKVTPTAPSQQAPVKENLDKVKQEHQKVLSRYKKTQQDDDPISAEDTEYFDRIVQRVMSKDKQSN